MSKRQFTEKSTKEFKYLLYNELWKDIFLCDDVNTSFNAFMSTNVYYFKRAFPLKIIYVKDQNENKWITHGLKFKVKTMRFFNSSKTITSFKKNTGLYKEISNNLQQAYNRS